MITSLARLQAAALLVAAAAAAVLAGCSAQARPAISAPTSPPPTVEPTRQPSPTVEPTAPPTTPVPSSESVLGFLYRFTVALPAGGHFVTHAGDQGLVEWLDGWHEQGERRGIALAVAEPGWMHVCPGDTGRVDLGKSPAEVLTTIRDSGGMGLSDPVETSVDGRFALATDLDPSASTCWRNEIHPNNDAPGLAGIAFPVGDAPTRIVAFEVNGTTVLALLWADTAAVLADWLPTAQAALDTVRFELRD